jgi:hypothetical protein
LIDKPVDQVTLPAVPANIWKFCIFTQLDPASLARSLRVCKQWNEWASDDAVWNRYNLQALFPKITFEFMDAEFWEKHIPAKCAFHAPAISKRQIIAALARIKGAATASIVSMPQGYSTAKLKKLMKIYKGGVQITMNLHADPTFRKKGIENTQVLTPYTFVAVSDYKDEDKDFCIPEIESAAKNFGLELAQILEVSTLNFFRAVSSHGNPTYVPNTAICTERGQRFPWTVFHRCVYVTQEVIPHTIHIECVDASFLNRSFINFCGVKRFPIQAPSDLMISGSK